LDVFVIGRFEPTEQLAIYANCYAHLPIDFIPIAFLTVLIPRITTYVQNRNITGGTRLMQNFVKVAYMTTWAFGTACIVLTPQAINFLYGSKYLEGSTIFILYAIADMLCLSHISIFLSAKGDTKTLMWISLGTLGIKLLFNFLAYLLIGFIGPALVTVIVMTCSTLYLLKKSAAIFNCSFSKLFDWRHLLKFLASCILFGGCTLTFRFYLEQLNWNSTIILILLGFLCSVSILGTNCNELRHAFTRLNQND
jgi:O-antigen/teichoic acid export membrane protein